MPSLSDHGEKQSFDRCRHVYYKIEVANNADTQMSQSVASYGTNRAKLIPKIKEVIPKKATHLLRGPSFGIG